MKRIDSLQQLKHEAAINRNVWLLLYKSGSAQSDCAYKNLSKSEEQVKNSFICFADLNEVRDIHPEVGITSVPSLLHFESGRLKQVIKGCHRPEQFTVMIDKPKEASQAATGMVLQKNVIVYTTPTCSWCNTIKRHLRHYGISYHEVDVSVNPKAAEEMIRRSGRQGVPQTVINGEVIVGFDKTKINTLLGINN